MYFVAIWCTYFVAIWYILWPICVFYGYLLYVLFPVLVCYTKKNLATLPRTMVNEQNVIFFAQNWQKIAEICDPNIDP
jgi:hypothetical protein